MGGQYISLSPLSMDDMDHHNGLPKWTTLMDCEMDYLDGLPIWTTEKKLPWKKDRKKYYHLVVCFGRFTAIRHLVFISCLLPLFLNLWSPNINMSRVCHGRNMSHVCYTLVAPGVNNLASFPYVNPLKVSVNIIYMVYTIYKYKPITHICKTP